MASLTQTAILTRKIVRYSIFFIIFLIVGRIFLGVAIGVVTRIFPPKAPPPTVRYGQLPALPFPQKETTPSLNYTIETPEGSLPKLTDQTKVYFMPQAKSDLLSLDTAKRVSTSLGFTGNGTPINQTLYRFPGANAFSNLEMNIITKTFSIGYNLNADSSPIINLPPTSENAASITKNFLNRATLFPDDLSGPVTQEYLKIQNKQLVKAVSLSDANLTKINLFRKDYDKLPSVTPKPAEGNVWFILSGSSEQGKQIVNAQYYYYPVDETQFSTYPIKTSEEAFKELQEGKGYIANLAGNKDGKVIIRRIYLAYYDANVSTEFYQPVIVFEGDNGDPLTSNFVAYVPAVKGEYYAK